MRILFIALTFFAAFALPGPAVSGADDAALRGLVAAENTFARAAAEHGIRESFLQFFAKDALVFAPEPKNGQKFYRQDKDRGFKLVWQPIFATLASSSDLGLTTGPWELQKSKTDATALGWGEFVSIWKQQPDKSWKVALDVGIDHAEPREPPGELHLLYPDASATPAPAEVEAARRAFSQATDEFRELLREGSGSAITAVASEDVRIFRENTFPAVGKAAAKLMLAAENGDMTRTKSAGGMSQAADFAWECGSFVYGKPNGQDKGWYLSVWRSSANDWKLLIDLQKKAPPPKGRK
jgi:ketosteroid isomerase-like protein